MPLTVLTASAPQVVALRELPTAEAAALYVHVPFCFHKCHYCDFYSITRQTDDRMGRYVDRVLAELDLWLDSSPVRVVPRTVFFGGGTPSLLPIEHMDRLLRSLRDRLDFSRLEEWTIEVNPATADLDYCRMLRSHGVDRLSLGAQSFDERELALLERHHHPDEVAESVRIVTDAGFKRVNLDLIYAIPTQTLESWGRSLAAALAMQTGHLSCYGLTYEPNTPIAVRRRLGEFTPADDDLEVAMFRLARRTLRAAGFQSYEISNHARPGQECRHNLVYWSGGNYVGLGPSAASHVAGVRFRNKPHLGEWELAVDHRQLPITDAERLTARQRADELVMLRLRCDAGVDLADFAERCGLDAGSLYAEALRELEVLRLIERDGRGFRLTEAALPVADAVIARLVTSDHHAPGEAVV